MILARMKEKSLTLGIERIIDCFHMTGDGDLARTMQ